MSLSISELVNGTAAPVDPAVPAPDATPDATLDPNATPAATDPGTTPTDAVDPNKVVNPATPAEPVVDDTIIDPETFWKSVDELSGRPLTVDYGTTERNSPEGILLRDKAIEQRAYDDFEQHLEKTQPHAYAFYLHIMGGGTDEEFFSTKIPTLPSYDVFKSDVDLQLQTYKKELISTGRDPDEVEALVKALEKKGPDEIFKKANSIYQKTLEQTNNQLASVKAANDKRQADMDRRVQQINQTLESTINGKLNITIPEVDRPGFSKFVKESLRESEGNFFIVQPVEKDTISRITEAMYFLFKNGDLNQLVQRKAGTVFVARTKAAVDAAAQKIAVAGEPQKQKLTVAQLMNHGQQ